jgi:hypothetical protein
MNIGDLVKMKHGYSQSGVILEFRQEGKWVMVHWPDYGPGLEKVRDIEVINESR